MPTITTIVATLSDGTSVTLFPVAPVVAPVAPTNTEVDVTLSDGTVEKFVPAPTA